MSFPHKPPRLLITMHTNPVVPDVCLQLVSFRKHYRLQSSLVGNYQESVEGPAPVRPPAGQALKQMLCY